MLINFWQDYQALAIGLAAMAGALIVAAFLHKLAFYIAGRIAGRTPNMFDNSLIRRAQMPSMAAVLVFVALVFLPSVPMPERLSVVLHRIAVLLLTASIGWLVASCLGTVKDVVASRFDINRPDNLRARQVWTQTLMLHRFAVGVVIVLTVCFMLMSIPGIRQIGVSLFASAGVAAVVIGFSAQQVLKNVLAGIQLALTAPVRVDDVVIVEGEWGKIEEIRSTYIVVKSWDLRRLVVPLSYFLEKPFQNWTRRSADLLGTVLLYVDYTTPVNRVREQAEKTVKSNPLWDGNVFGLQVTDLKDRTMELRVLVSAANSGNAWDLRCQVREALIGWLQREFPESLPRVRAEVHPDGHDQAPFQVRAETLPRPS